MTRTQVFRLCEPALFVVVVCGATLILSQFKWLHAGNRVRTVNALKAAAPISISSERPLSRRSLQAKREFDAYLVACAAGDASACSKADALQQRVQALRDDVVR